MSFDARRWRWLGWRDAFNQGFGFGLDLFVCTARAEVYRSRLLEKLKARFGIFEAWIVMAQSFNDVVWGFKMLVRYKHQINLQARFHLGDVGTLFIEQEGGDFDRDLGVNRCRVFFHGFFLQQAQYMQCARFGVTDDTSAIAARASDV